MPFGELGAIQNMSRDWVIDKMSLVVSYDTDIDKARKIIKKIGLELAADPEFASIVIEPLKMQGVQNFGDYGIELRHRWDRKPSKRPFPTTTPYVIRHYRHDLREPSMQAVTTIGLEIAKSVFQVHGVDAQVR